MGTSPTFLDTNVFLYAAGGEHPLRAPCQRLVHQVADGSLVAVTNTEVIQEILYVLTRRGRRTEAIQLARKVLALVTGVLAVESADLALACELLEDHPALPVRDAIHAATMRNQGLARLISADAHFDEVPGLVRTAPEAAGA